MNETKGKTTRTDSWGIVLIACYFFIPYYGLRIALENYLVEDDLPITYTMLLALVGGIITTTMIFIMDGKTIKRKLIGTLVILAIIVFINLAVG